MAVVAQCQAGCLSTDLREFLASSPNKAQGTAGHQLLRKLLSICTGKCELGEQQPCLAPAQGDVGERRSEQVEQPAALRRSLRPRRHAPAASQQQHQQQQQRTQRLVKEPKRRQQQQQQIGSEPPQSPQPQPQQQGWEQPAGDGTGVGDLALCADLLGIVRRESGVVLALALHAMHIWSQGNAARTQACIQQGVVPVLLQVLVVVLSESPATPTGAYAASMVVILLRTLTRSGEEGMAAFVGGGGVGALLRLLPTLREDRALCLALYLLSDVTRRSAQALGQAVQAGGVALVVACLRHPLGESTKFAALLINRWCLLAPLGEQFRGAGAMDSLLCVLRRQHSATAAAPGPATNQQQQPDGTAGRVLLSEVSAYSLSALAILGQEDPHLMRSLLAECPANLAAVTRAMTEYERSFQGTGFPHALLSSLLEGAEGCALAAQVVRSTELLPAWLSLRQVGWELVERAAQPDVLAALDALPEDAQGGVAQSLTLLLPHSRAFLPLLTDLDRLESITRGASAELLATTASPSTGLTTSTLRVPLSSSSSSDAACQPQPGPHSLALRPSVSAPALLPAAQGKAAGEQRPRRVSLPEDLDSKQHSTTSPTDEEMVDAAAVAAGTEQAAVEPQPHAGERQLQRGVSIIPEALQLEAISQQQQQQEAAEAEAEAQQQREQQQQQEQEQAAEAEVLASACASLLASCTANPQPAPFTAALRRLLSWLGEANEAQSQPQTQVQALPSNAAAGSKRGREEEGSSTAGGAASKRAACGFAFSRADVNARRYDSLTFIVGGREFHAVGFVLEAHSPLLRSLLGTLESVREALPIPCVAGFDPDRMYTLFGWAVEYCYTGGVEGLTPADALDLWTLAEFLQIDGLQRECEAVLSPAHARSSGSLSLQPGAAGAAGGSLLGARYALGLAYPSGRRLRLAVAREVLARLAAQGPPPPPTEAVECAAAAGGVGWEVGADAAEVLAAHPWEMAADMARALAGELDALQS